MKQTEYIEGPEALENFKRLATAILQAPNTKKKRPRAPRFAVFEAWDSADCVHLGVAISPIRIRSAAE